MKYFGLTDAGRVRKNNQDSFSCMELGNDCMIAVVCDGMGGAAGGSVASSIAKDVYLSTLQRSLNAYFASDGKGGTEVVAIPRAMREAVSACNRFVYELSLGDKSLRGMGTTLVSAVVYRKRVFVCNVGDSRAYLFFDDSYRQITKDHSFVQSLVDSGRLTEQQARKSDQKNIITRAVGIDRQIEADTFVLDLDAVRYILLCSDGLSNDLSGEEIAKVLSQPSDILGFERKVRCLIDLANQRGGKDNITALLIGMTEREGEL